VHRKITPIFAEKKLALKDTSRSVTPFGGLAVFAEFLARIGFHREVEAAMPVVYESPNAIPPAHTFGVFLFSVLAGARRFAHAGLLRADLAMREILGIKRIAGEDTIGNLFRRFGMGECHRFFSSLWSWMLLRQPERPDGYTVDMDSTVFERYGKQEGARKGYNPGRKGRQSHHPLLAVLAETRFILHGWLRSGNCGTARGVTAFLREALALLPPTITIRLLRADSGFFEDDLLTFLEEHRLPYIIVARMTRRIKETVCWNIPEDHWRVLDENYSVAEVRVRLMGWKAERRFVVVRERVREGKAAVGRRLLDVPGYTFRVFVTSTNLSPEEVWRTYAGRADIENRISELKSDLEADSFCMRNFFATEAAFRSILMLFNLLGEFQRAAGIKAYKRPATLRTAVFLCGAILGRAGHTAVLHMSLAWGGIKKRIPLMDNILDYKNSTSPKLPPATA
jgi:hypothetical protein